MSRPKRRSLNGPRLPGDAPLFVAAIGAAVAVAGCRANSAGLADSSPPVFGPDTEQFAREPDANLAGLNVAPLMIANNGVSAPVRRVLLVIDEGLLKVVGSTSTMISCESPAPPLGAASFETTIDPGPSGDFYIGRPVPALVSFRVPGDPVPVRDVYPSAARIQIEAWKEGDDRTNVRMDVRRMLMQPDPHTPRLVVISGRSEAFVCPSVASRGEAVPTELEGPVRIRMGERTFAPGTILAFREADGQNPDAVSSIGFFEAAGVSCDGASRPLWDDGGGANGIQINTSGLAIGFGVPNPGHVTHTIEAEACDVTAGGVWFEKRLLTEKPLRGFIHVGAADLREASGRLFGSVHAETAPSEGIMPAAIDGVFEAQVCGRAP